MIEVLAAEHWELQTSGACWEIVTILWVESLVCLFLTSCIDCSNTSLLFYLNVNESAERKESFCNANCTHSGAYQQNNLKVFDLR